MVLAAWAILVDTAIVHPVSAIDDAAGDAADVWRELDWRKQYYTELAFLPLRVAWTPLKFAFSWLGRSCFDIKPRASRDPVVLAEAAKRVAAARRAACLAFMDALEHQNAAAQWPDAPVAEWDVELAAGFDRAYRTANAPARFVLLRAAVQLQFPPLVDEPWLGLRDRDPVVRWRVLNAWSGGALPDGVRGALLADENEMVRALAAEKLRE